MKKLIIILPSILFLLASYSASAADFDEEFGGNGDDCKSEDSAYHPEIHKNQCGSGVNAENQFAIDFLRSHSGATGGGMTIHQRVQRSSNTRD